MVCNVSLLGWNRLAESEKEYQQPEGEGEGAVAVILLMDDSGSGKNCGNVDWENRKG